MLAFNKWLNRSPAGAKPKKRIARISKRRAAQTRTYTVVRKEYLAAHPICQHGGCMKRSTEIHHRKGCIGELLTNERFFMAVCRPHHNHIHRYSQEARAQGYIL